MSDDKIENMIQEEGLNAPRVTPDDLKNNIVHVEYVKHVTHSGKVLRWCILTTRNGFAVTGDPSASVSVENDNARVGEEVAYENAFRKLWPLMGYELATQLKAEADRRKLTDLLGEGGCSGCTI